MRRNPAFARLKTGYIFPEVQKRRAALAARESSAKIISLGIGDTTEPLLPHTTSALRDAAQRLGSAAGYSGYGDSQGNPELRAKIAEVIYGNKLKATEVFISDGCKCDIGRLQFMFGAAASFTVQDPSYPVFVDGSVLAGQSGEPQGNSGYFSGVQYLKCTPENGFFPDLSGVPRSDLIYYCSPNNPTGAVASRQQLEQLVSFARINRSIVVFDGAYSRFIRNPDLPRSIFEIEGAKEVCIELGSFSKPAGFAGVRLGWAVVPESLSYDDGTSVRADWDRLITTIFNGASNIAQAGGLALLDAVGLKEMGATVDYYMGNAELLREVFVRGGMETYGGTDSPYLWVRFPGSTSWQTFDRLLESAHIVCTPGSGFGPSGEGFIRISAFGHRSDIEQACQRLYRFFDEHGA